ncbi:MAG: hypothetical protein ABIP36_03275 [Acidimicrobiales bacterium]
MAIHNCNPSKTVLLIAAVGGVSALVGTYWDDTWHTDRGRDTFLAPPHIVLYLSVLAATAAVAFLGRRPWGPAQRLALTGGAAVLVSAPLDEVWHRAFGRDAVAWSPPHMFAVLAALMLATGVLAVAATVAGRWGRAAQLLGASTVIGVLQVPVFEFDSDVPQFPEWTYLPVAVAGWLLAIEIVRRLLPGRRSLIVAAGVYTVIRVGVVGLLAALGHSATIVPPILVLAVLHEVAERVPLRRSLRLVGEALGATLIWFLWLKAFGGAATAVSATNLPAALALAGLAAAGVSVITHRGGWARPAVLPAGAALVVVTLSVGLVLAPDAGAHDPGQGRPTREATLTVERVDAGSVVVELDVRSASCGDLIARRIAARRAGTTNVGTLEVAGSCRYSGVIDAEAVGRWFIYVELTDGDRQVELWAPLAGGEATARVLRPLYEPPERPSSGLQVVGGVTLYAAILGMLVFTVRSSAHIGASGAGGKARR